jgi:aspartate-semialdehyde dehydrogenase
VLARSARRAVLAGETFEVEVAEPEAFEGVEFALFAGTEGEKGAAVQLAREAISRGAIVIDNGSDFRLDPEVPLVVPEVNADAAAAHRGIVSNPNCSTIQLVVALKPLHDAARIRHLTIATYQAVSGTGKRAMDELRDQSRALLDGGAVEASVYPHAIAFNALPQCDVFDGDETTEERKLVKETHKILGDESIGISATCVRVPVWRSHSEAVWIETETPLGAAQARELLESAPGVRVVDDPATARYPMPSEATGADDVLVGRIREDRSRRNGLALWVVADNLRKGAALNGVQIAELLHARGLLHVPARERVA